MQEVHVFWYYFPLIIYAVYFAFLILKVRFSYKMWFSNLQFWLFKSLHDCYYEAKQWSWKACELLALKKSQEIIDEIYPFKTPKWE